MTLTAEMSRLTLVFANSRSKRQTEIGQMNAALKRQIKDGRVSAKLTSKTLFDAIEHDLKAISRDVAANRKAASSLIKIFSTGRHAEAKLLRSKLDADRKHVTVTVKNIIDGLELDRLGARQVVRSWAVARKIKVAPAKTAAPAVVAKSDAAKVTPTPPAAQVSKPRDTK